MDTNSRIRKIHRWISQIFTLTVIASFIVVVFAGDAAQWVLYTPLPPLFVLLFTGLYMFWKPYLARRQAT